MGAFAIIAVVHICAFERAIITECFSVCTTHWLVDRFTKTALIPCATMIEQPTLLLRMDLSVARHRHCSTNQGIYNVHIEIELAMNAFGSLLAHTPFVCPAIGNAAVDAWLVLKLINALSLCAGNGARSAACNLHIECERKC